MVAGSKQFFELYNYDLLLETQLRLEPELHYFDCGSSALIVVLGLRNMLKMFITVGCTCKFSLDAVIFFCGIDTDVTQTQYNSKACTKLTTLVVMVVVIHILIPGPYCL